MKKILMASAAALTLFGGTAFAQMQGGAPDQDQTRHTQSLPDKGQQQAEPQSQMVPGEGAGPQNTNTMQPDNRAAPRNGMREDRDMQEEHGQNAREERHEGPARITPTKVLSGTEKERIQRTVIESGSAPRVENLSFSVRVGAPIPRSVHLVPVPEDIVTINPQWNGFLYFVSGDEIVVVDPNSFDVVGVLEA